MKIMNTLTATVFSAFPMLFIVLSFQQLICTAQPTIDSNNTRYAGLSIREIVDTNMKKEVAFIYMRFGKRTDSIRPLTMDTMTGSHVSYDSTLTFARDIKKIHDYFELKFSEVNQSGSSTKYIKVDTIVYSRYGTRIVLVDSAIFNSNKSDLLVVCQDDGLYKSSSFYRAYHSRIAERAYFTMLVSEETSVYIITWIIEDGQYKYRLVDKLDAE